jgi:hypothetical protein
MGAADMTEKKHVPMLADNPPASTDDSPPKIDFGALAAGVKQLDDQRLMAVLCTLIALCSPDVPVALTKH